MCRNLDLGATGHGCTSVIGVEATQGTVFANNKPVARQFDPALPHVIRKGLLCVGHRAQINRGSRSVFCRNIPVARIGDSFDRGRMITGSVNVFAGG
tara:strand:- start:20 stop:310 length:291 start_codon:yes stop_codon:yes gene_type:complete